MTERFMRPAQCLSVSTGQRAHCELFNPAGSGYHVILEKMFVSAGAGGFSILGKGSPMLDNATFPESRGLPIIDGAPRQYSSAHARMKVTAAGTEVIQGGQWFNQDTHSGIFVFDVPAIIGEGTGMLIRANTDGQKLSVSFQWREEPI